MTTDGIARVTFVAEPVPPESADVRTPTDDLVDLWFMETFYNRGYPAEEFNRFSAAKEGLKARLSALAGKE